MLRKISSHEFVRRLQLATGQPQMEVPYAFFLGAGCSVSSGIPAASTLVKTVWLPRLRDLRSPSVTDVDEWARKEFPGYDPSQPSQSYGTVIDALFLQPEERQREIESLCDNKTPGFGYATLATLVAQYPGHFNVVLTTNFDDMVADGMYLFTESRPLVIHHESLAGFIRSTRTRPLVVKLHGDHRLAPHNTPDETSSLNAQMARSIRALLHDRGLIFVGYGGNDRGICDLLSQLPDEALPFGVFWVSGSEPQGILRPWLEKRNAVWVDNGDFDELMVLVRDALALPHPNPKRFDTVFQGYQETWKKLSQRLLSKPAANKDDEELRIAVDRTDKAFPDHWSVIFAAERMAKTDPGRAEAIYSDGIKRYPKSADLLGSFAVFLDDVQKEYDRAEEFYRRAVDANPSHASNLGNYAIFLKNIRLDYDRAEEFYRRAIEADPSQSNILGNYANFFKSIRGDYDKAEEYFRRAVDADPGDANALGKYAVFLDEIRHDPKADEFFRRAIDADPMNADQLGNYALFLHTTMKDHNRAEEFYRRAFDADPLHVNNLCNYAMFLDSVRRDYDKAEECFAKALDADPSNPDLLALYALFLARDGRDNVRAGEYFSRAMQLQPETLSTLVNGAGFLLSQGDSEGMEILQRVLDDPRTKGPLDYCVEAWFYAYVHWPEQRQPEALRSLRSAISMGGRSPGWDFGLHLAWADIHGHPAGHWLHELASVITEGLTPDALNDWPAWNQADASHDQTQSAG